MPMHAHDRCPQHLPCSCSQARSLHFSHASWQPPTHLASLGCAVELGMLCDGQRVGPLHQGAHLGRMGGRQELWRLCCMLGRHVVRCRPLVQAAVTAPLTALTLAEGRLHTYCLMCALPFRPNTLDRLTCGFQSPNRSSTWRLRFSPSSCAAQHSDHSHC